MNQQSALTILKKIEQMYPDAQCELYHKTAYQLLVATILSAQCTDKRVNQITPQLFNIAPTPKAMLLLGQAKLESMIHSCGFYKNKSKNILAMSQILLDIYQSEVPTTMEELTKLPGVGRKTANVVLFNAFGIPGFAVDTHVFRVSQRLGLASGKSPEQIESQLCKLYPKNIWGKAHHLFIFHGRYTCKAARPMCETCSLTSKCTYYRDVKNSRA